MSIFFMVIIASNARLATAGSGSVMASVRTIGDLRTAIAQIPADSGAVLQVGRQGRLRFITVTLE